MANISASINLLCNCLLILSISLLSHSLCVFNSAQWIFVKVMMRAIYTNIYICIWMHCGEHCKVWFLVFWAQLLHIMLKTTTSNTKKDKQVAGQICLADILLDFLSLVFPCAPNGYSWQWNTHTPMLIAHFFSWFSPLKPF